MKKIITLMFCITFIANASIRTQHTSIKDGYQKIFDKLDGFQELLIKGRYKYRHDFKTLLDNNRDTKNANVESMKVFASKLENLKQELMLNERFPQPMKAIASSSLSSSIQILTSLVLSEMVKLQAKDTRSDIEQAQAEIKRLGEQLAMSQALNKKVKVVTLDSSKNKSFFSSPVNLIFIALFTVLSALLGKLFFAIKRNEKAHKEELRNEEIKFKMKKIVKISTFKNLIVAHLDQDGNVLEMSDKFEENFGTEVRKYNSNWAETFSSLFEVDTKIKIQNCFTFLKEPLSRFVIEKSKIPKSKHSLVEVTKFNARDLFNYSTTLASNVSTDSCQIEDVVDEALCEIANTQMIKNFEITAIDSKVTFYDSTKISFVLKRIFEFSNTIFTLTEDKNCIVNLSQTSTDRLISANFTLKNISEDILQKDEVIDAIKKLSNDISQKDGEIVVSHRKARKMNDLVVSLKIYDQEANINHEDLSVIQA